MKLDHNVNISLNFGNMSELTQLINELKNLTLQGDNIMSGIKDFASQQNSVLDKVHKAVEGLTKDVRKQTSIIEKLQSSPGQITPDDQKLLDALQERTKQLADKLTALDDLNADSEEGEASQPSSGSGELATGGANAGGSDQPSTQPAGGSINEAAGNPNAGSGGQDLAKEEAKAKKGSNDDRDTGSLDEDTE